MWSLLFPLFFSAAFFEFFKRHFDNLAALGLSGAAGFLAFSWAGLAGYWFFGLGAGFWFSAFLSVAALLVSVWHFGFFVPDFSRIWREHRFFVFFLFFATLGFSYLSFTHFVSVQPDGWYSSGNTWGDLPFHLGVINYFAFGQSYPPQYVVFDSVLGYPFLADFSAALLVVGASIQWVLVFSSVFWFVSFLVLTYCVGLRLGFSKIACVLALVLLLFSGGFGFLDFLSSASRDGVGAALMAKDYTIVPPTAWTNVVTSLFLPQRTLLMGAMVFAAVFFLLLHASRRRDFLLAGVLAGLMPLVHWHSFLVALGVGMVYAALDSDRQKWAWFFVPAVSLAVPQALWSLQQLSPESLVHFQPNWTVNTLDAGISAGFWLMQTGLWIPAVLFGIWIASKEQGLRFLPFGLLFLLAASVAFQPYAYDNLKFFFFVQWAAAFLIAAALLRLAQHKEFLLKAAAVLVFVVLVFSGALSVAREANLHWRLYDANDLELAEWVKVNASRDALFLTSSAHNNPVSSLAGRRTVMGYPGWLWSHGFPYAGVESDVRAMFAGDFRLLKTRGVNYVVLDSKVRQDYSVNESVFSSFPLVFENSAYRVRAVGRDQNT